jgi:hypothetical protein
VVQASKEYLLAIKDKGSEMDDVVVVVVVKQVPGCKVR